MATQKERVLSMLRAAGSFGVRSDTYLAEYIPRAAARIKELREEGYEITSEREKQFTRYVLVGSSAEPVGLAGGSSPTAQPPGVADHGRHLRTAGSSAASSEDAHPCHPAPGGESDDRAQGPARQVGIEAAVHLRREAAPRPSMFDYDADWEAA